MRTQTLSGETKLKTSSSAGRRSSGYEYRLASILKAASRVFASEGFQGASMRAVAAEAGIGLSGIYHYFSGKEQILFALQSHTFHTLIESLQERLENTDTPELRLRAVAENHFEYFVNNMDDLKVCVHELETLSGESYEEILQLRRRYYKQVGGIVAEVSGGQNEDTELVTLYLFGALNWVYMWYDPREHGDTDRLARRLVDVFLGGVSAVPSRQSKITKQRARKD